MRPKKAKQIETINQAPAAVEKGYVAKWLVICTFPHSKPDDTKYVRINGDYTLTILSGADERGDYLGLPYGAPARLLSFWIITEANRLKWAGDNSRRIHLGESMSRFVQLVGYDPETGRGKRGDATRLRDMMQRLFRCRISFTRSQTADGPTGVSWLDMQVAPKGELWWDMRSPDQASLFDSWIELGEDFYNAVTTSPVPIDFRALVALKHSPMAMDLYAWLTYRVHGMSDGMSASIPLHGPKGLAAQIGSDYKQRKNFTAAIRDGLEAVRMVWPSLTYDVSTTHLNVSKCPVPIADEPISKKRRAFGQVKANALMIDTEIEFRKANPRIRLTTVKKAFFAFLEREQIKPHDIDALFRDYAAKWVKGEV